MLLLLGALILATTTARAASYVPVPVERQAAEADAVFRGEAVSRTAFRARDGHIYSETLFRVREGLKGRFAETIRLVHRGGNLPRGSEWFSASPDFRLGDEYLIFVSRRADGSLSAQEGRAVGLRKGEPNAQLAQVRSYLGTHGSAGADMTDQATLQTPTAQSTASSSEPSGASQLPGLLPNNPRLTLPDRGEPIPYILDFPNLPPGITQAQALTAVQNAFAAWAAVTGVTFVFEGYQDFGGSALYLRPHDGKIRIQCKDDANMEPNTLGAATSSSELIAFPGNGGIFSDTEFIETSGGLIELNPVHESMTNLQNFEHVVCHEIGHVLGLAHSSEDVNETNPTLRDAMMYRSLHPNRGAVLGSYDPPIVGPVYPTGDRPPYVPHRYLRVVTTAAPATTAGVNEIEFRLFDLHTPSDQLVVTTEGASSNFGTFTRTGLTVKYTPTAFPGPNVSWEPDGDFFYAMDFFTLRVSDGTHARLVGIDVLSYSPDTFPTSAGDGIPDNWMTQHFGHANPVTGPNRGANNDFDGDGRTNLQEFREGTLPTNPASAFRISSFNGARLSWSTRPYEVYDVHRSSDLVNWTRVAWPLAAYESTTSRVVAPGAAAKQFYRAEKVK